MGKKRRNRKNSKGDDEEDDEQDDDAEEGKGGDSKQSFTELKTFTEKREFQRQQAAEKRKSKQRCYLCGKLGHVRRECPGIADDGRGMSRFKGMSDAKHEKEKRDLAKREKLIQQRYHSMSTEDRLAEVDYFDLVDWPEGFTHPPEDDDEEEHVDEEVENDHHPDPLQPLLPIPHPFFDPHCRVLESIEYMQTQRTSKSSGKNKKDDSAPGEATFREYQAIWNRALETTALSGIIVPTVVSNHRPWSNPIPWLGEAEENENDGGDEEEPSSSLPSRKVPILFSLGLAPTTPCETEAEQAEAKQLLLETIRADEANQIAALWAILDYTKPKRTHESQQLKLKCSLQVAQETNLTLQVQVLPGIPSELATFDASVAGTDYAQALLGFQGILAEHLTTTTTQSSEGASTRIHLVGWQGRSDHTLSLLKAFSPTNGCHLYLGLDPSVTFSKANWLHELAFEVPLERLILETSQVIPSSITKRLGRSAAPHAAWWPFVAEAIAQHSKRYSVAHITKVVTENIQTLYPGLRGHGKEMSKEAEVAS